MPDDERLPGDMLVIRNILVINNNSLCCLVAEVSDGLDDVRRALAGETHRLDEHDSFALHTDLHADLEDEDPLSDQLVATIGNASATLRGA